MKLPKHLASRYSQMGPNEMEGSGQAKDLIQQAMLNKGGRPGVISAGDRELNKEVARPGVIAWDPSKPAGVWFNMRKAGMDPMPTAMDLAIDKVLHSRYVQQDVNQGRDVREFQNQSPPAAVKSEENKIIAQVKAADSAATVEAKATALAAKAKATKEAALAGLSRLGYYGEDAPADAPKTAPAPTGDGMMKKILIALALVVVGILIHKKFMAGSAT